MQKGVIFCVSLGKEEQTMLGQPDLARMVRSLNASAVYVATSEEEVVHGWSYLIAAGMHRISCATTAYDPAMGKFEIYETPLRLWTGSMERLFPMDGEDRGVNGIHACGAELS